MTTLKPKQDTNSQIIQLLESFKNTVIELGVTNAITHLENRNKNLLLNSVEAKIITESVCEAFNIPESVLFSNAKKYPRKYAFGLWVSLCLTELKFSYPIIQNLSGKARITIYKAKQFIENYPNQSNFDKKVHDKIALTKQIILDKQNNKQ
jgi:chromosomal replication initiation ATPase DnaA